MQIKSIVAAVGVVLLPTAVAAQPGDSFDTLTGVVTTEMSQTELSDVRGANVVVGNIPLRTDLDLDVALGFSILLDVENPPQGGINPCILPDPAENR